MDETNGVYDYYVMRVIYDRMTNEERIKAYAIAAEQGRFVYVFKDGENAKRINEKGELI